MAEVDPDRGHDAWEDERHEMEILERHLQGGLAPDTQAEARVAELDRKLGSSGAER